VSRLTTDDAAPISVYTQRMTTEQLQRAWCLMLVNLLYPTATVAQGTSIARWIYDGKASTS